MSPLRRAARRLGLRRDNLRSARVLVERRFRAARPGARPATGGRILCYHSVGTPEWGCNDVPPDRFRRHLELALGRGHRFVPADVIGRTGGEPGDLAVTFDDGLRSVAANAAPVLAELDIPWTLFVVSGWASGEHWPAAARLFLGWDELVVLARRGMSLGSHSVSHPSFGRLHLELARRELVDSRQQIEAATGLLVASFAIPFGRSKDWNPLCTELARLAGYELIYSAGGSGLPGTVPRTLITRWDGDRVFLAALEGAFDSTGSEGQRTGTSA